jgi:hypothetical protein
MSRKWVCRIEMWNVYLYYMPIAYVCRLRGYSRPYGSQQHSDSRTNETSSTQASPKGPAFTTTLHFLQCRPSRKGDRQKRRSDRFRRRLQRMRGWKQRETNDRAHPEYSYPARRTVGKTEWRETLSDFVTDKIDRHTIRKRRLS